VDDGLGEAAVGVNVISGDRGAGIVGDEGRLSSGVDRDVARAGASCGDLVDGLEGTGLCVDDEAGDGGGGVIGFIRGVEAALLAGCGWR